ncbi:hypothetical protein F2Q69_00029904 [Brassica cretica]|uniref:Uncharacterized protein n=1 Tax=Brassica cretica TaxID=69181 RepID=A0A8S9S6J7_BRACR|nr:hypothetical protein F2Q69_00029904 [Brassica cretica]
MLSSTAVAVLIVGIKLAVTGIEPRRRDRVKKATMVIFGLFAHLVPDFLSTFNSGPDFGMYRNAPANQTQSPNCEF